MNIYVNFVEFEQLVKIVNIYTQLRLVFTVLSCFLLI
jgi:hypothetical protein